MSKDTESQSTPDKQSAPFHPLSCSHCSSPRLVLELEGAPPAHKTGSPCCCPDAVWLQASRKCTWIHMMCPNLSTATTKIEHNPLISPLVQKTGIKQLPHVRYSGQGGKCRVVHGPASRSQPWLAYLPSKEKLRSSKSRCPNTTLSPHKGHCVTTAPMQGYYRLKIQRRALHWAQCYSDTMSSWLELKGLSWRRMKYSGWWGWKSWKGLLNINISTQGRAEQSGPMCSRVISQTGHLWHILSLPNVFHPITSPL